MNPLKLVLRSDPQFRREATRIMDNPNIFRHSDLDFHGRSLYNWLGL